MTAVSKWQLIPQVDKKIKKDGLQEMAGQHMLASFDGFLGYFMDANDKILAEKKHKNHGDPTTG